MRRVLRICPLFGRFLLPVNFFIICCISAAVRQLMYNRRMTAHIELQAQLRNRLIPAMATPIDASGHRVDESQIPLLVDFLIDRGVGGLFVGGTTGEGILLDVSERKRLHEATVMAAAGRVPVLLHVGCNVTRHTFDLAAHAQTLDADGIVVVTPYFYPLDDDALLAYFDLTAGAAPNTPLLIYDIPHFANNGISPALVPRLVTEVETFVGLKCSRHDAQAIRALLAALPDDKILLAGNERILLGSLAMGAAGAISGLATAVPEPFVALLEAVAADAWQEAQRWHRVINHLLDVLTGPRIGNIKAILAARGVPVGRPIPPRPAGEPAIWQALLAHLEP
jgi:dihydrodipicolinate synthase/N-acetylneuraminate lyase